MSNSSSAEDATATSEGRTVTIALGNHQYDKHYKNTTLSVPALVKYLKTYRSTHNKHGKNFMCGSVVYDTDDTTEGKEKIRGRVIHANMKQMELIGFDIDNGMTLEAAIKVVKESGYLGVIYTSYKHTNEAPRFRVVFVLARPFVISDHKADNKRWKQIYAAVADKFGFPYDESCKNIGRKFYTHSSPAKPKAKPFADSYNETGGSLLDLNDFQSTSADMSAHFPAENEVIKTKDGYNLSLWASSYGKTFAMARLLNDTARKLVQNERPEGGYEIECPIGEHDSGDPMGAFVTDAHDEHGFNLWCIHNTCIKKHGDRHQKLHHLKKLIEDGVLTIADLENPEYGGGKPRSELPSGYFYNGTAILKQREGQGPVLVCDGVDFIGHARDYDSNWTLVCAVTAPDGVRKEVYLPKRIIGKEDALQEIRNAGATIPAHGKANMVNLLTTVKPEKHIRVVQKGGWHGDKFVLTGEAVTVFGSDEDEEVIYAPTGALKPAFNIGGTLADWQGAIGEQVRGNTRLEFVLCAAFAAPLLTPLGIDGGGFHLVGGSSIGKTIAGKVFGSVFGGPKYIHTHRGTDNALESVAEMHNDTGLVLDEISQSDSKTIGATIYMLFNGEGKQRAYASSDARPVKTWRVMVLSTGEITISDKMSEDSFGPAMKGGQSVRLVDLFADAGAEMGIVEDPHGLTPKAFVDGLSRSATTYYGTAIREFLAYLVEHKAEALQESLQTVKAFSHAVVPEKADGQVGRVADRFAICAVAGELAIKAGVLPWKKGDAIKVCKRMFNEWVGVRGYGSFEVAQGVKSVETFIHRFGGSRFEERSDPAMFPHDRTGWTEDKDGMRFYYIPCKDSWSLVCGNYDPTGTAKALAEAGVLKVKQVKGKPVYAMPIKIVGVGSVQCRVLMYPLVEEDAGKEEPEPHSPEQILAMA